MIAPWLEESWRTLEARIREGRVPHGLLIAGPAGLGKRDFAAALASRLLCTAPTAAGHACGACRGCALVAAGTHPDHLAVTLGLRDDGKSRTEIVVEQIRELSARLAMTSQFGGLQVVRIDPADAMNASAANALLKTLEEPSADTVIVLVSDEPARLPATIRSRCQRVDARFPPRATALAWLAERGVSAVAAATALDLAAGNPGLALELAQPAQSELVEDCANGLTALLSRRTPLVELAARWARDESASGRLAVLAQLARLLGWRRQGLVVGGSIALERLSSLTAQADFSKLWASWERANRARREFGGPLRPDLLWVEVLQSWLELAPRPLESSVRQA